MGFNAYWPTATIIGNIEFNKVLVDRKILTRRTTLCIVTCCH